MKKQQRYWTAAEDKIMREHYPVGGTRRAMKFLTDRAPGSIQSRASSLGLHIIGRKKRDDVASSEFIDAAIRRTYQSGGGRGKVRALAKQLGLKASWVVWRAQELGVSRMLPGSHGNYWNDAEKKILETGLENGRSITAIQRALKKAGFTRSLNAIANQVRVLGLSWENTAWSAQDVVRALGTSEGTVLRWLGSGKLKGERRRGPSTAYKPESPVMHWHIEPSAVREFMLNFPRDWDAKRMNQEVLIDLLAGGEYGLNSGGMGIGEARRLAG